jgi:hypothetical protein
MRIRISKEQTTQWPKEKGQTMIYKKYSMFKVKSLGNQKMLKMFDGKKTKRHVTRIA